MFEATLSKASPLKKLIDGLKEIVSQVNIEALDDGLMLESLGTI